MTLTTSSAPEAIDLVKIRDISNLKASPDRRKFVLQVHQADPKDDRYHSAWCLYDASSAKQPKLAIDAGDPIWSRSEGLLTGAWATPTPQWSPDGRWFAFIKRQNGEEQIWRAQADGSRITQVTHSAGDIRQFIFGSDGWTLIFRADPSRIALVERLREEGDVGYFYDDRFHAVSGAAPNLLSLGERGDIRALDLGTQVERVATDGEKKFFKAEVNRGIPSFGSLESASSKPNGEDVRLLSSDQATGEFAWGTPANKSVDGPLAPLTLRWAMRAASEVSRCAEPACTGNINDIWLASESHEVVFQKREERGFDVSGFYAWSPTSGMTRLVAYSAGVKECGLVASQLLCIAQESTKPPFLRSIDLRTGEQNIAHDLNPEFTHLNLARAQALQRATDKGDELLGYFVLPQDYRQEQRYPLVVVQYSARGFLRGGTGEEVPVQTLASKGFVVLVFQQPPLPQAVATTAMNQSEIMKALFLGLSKFTQHHEALDLAIQKLIDMGFVDPERIGLTGLSWGSNMAQYELVHSNRFAAMAVAGLSEMPPDWSLARESHRRRMVSELGWGYGSPTWRELSIVDKVEHIDVPVLIQASDAEYRTSLPNYAALKDAGKPIEMYVFPGETHVKNGPRHKLAVYQRNLDWLRYWLQGYVDESAEKRAQYDRWNALRAKRDGAQKKQAHANSP